MHELLHILFKINSVPQAELWVSLSLKPASFPGEKPLYPFTGGAAVTTLAIQIGARREKGAPILSAIPAYNSVFVIQAEGGSR